MTTVIITITGFLLALVSGWHVFATAAGADQAEAMGISLIVLLMGMFTVKQVWEADEDASGASIPVAWSIPAGLTAMAAGASPTIAAMTLYATAIAICAGLVHAAKSYMGGWAVFPSLAIVAGAAGFL